MVLSVGLFWPNGCATILHRPRFSIDDSTEPMLCPSTWWLPVVRAENLLLSWKSKSAVCVCLACCLDESDILRSCHGHRPPKLVFGRQVSLPSLPNLSRVLVLMDDSSKTVKIFEFDRSQRFFQNAHGYARFVGPYCPSCRAMTELRGVLRVRLRNSKSFWNVIICTSCRQTWDGQKQYTVSQLKALPYAEWVTDVVREYTNHVFSFVSTSIEENLAGVGIPNVLSVLVVSFLNPSVDFPGGDLEMILGHQGSVNAAYLLDSLRSCFHC